MIVFLIATLTAGFAADDDPKKDDPPAKREVLARDGIYKDQPGKEQEFVGVLERVKDPGGFGFQRFNPYRLKMTGPGKKEETREVHVGPHKEALAPYVGKRVKLVGKAIDMEVEGKKHREIWPARVERMQK